MVSSGAEVGTMPLELTLSLPAPSNIYYFLRQFFAKEVYQFFLEQQRRIHQYRHDVGEVSYSNPSSNHLFRPMGWTLFLEVFYLLDLTFSGLRIISFISMNESELIYFFCFIPSNSHKNKRDDYYRCTLVHIQTTGWSFKYVPTCDGDRSIT